MKRIKSFKLFESKDGMDVINYAEELMQDLWDISILGKLSLLRF